MKTKNTYIFHLLQSCKTAVASTADSFILIPYCVLLCPTLFLSLTLRDMSNVPLGLILLLVLYLLLFFHLPFLKLHTSSVAPAFKMRLAVHQRQQAG